MRKIPDIPPVELNPAPNQGSQMAKNTPPQAAPKPLPTPVIQGTGGHRPHAHDYHTEDPMVNEAPPANAPKASAHHGKTTKPAEFATSPFELLHGRPVELADETARRAFAALTFYGSITFSEEAKATVANALSKEAETTCALLRKADDIKHSLQRATGMALGDKIAPSEIAEAVELVVNALLNSR